MDDPIRESVDAILLRDAIEVILNTLTERQKAILKYRVYDDMTYRAIGDIFKISCERVRQIYQKGLRKLRLKRSHFEKLGDCHIDRIYARHDAYEREQKQKSYEWARRPKKFDALPKVIFTDPPPKIHEPIISTFFYVEPKPKVSQEPPLFVKLSHDGLKPILIVTEEYRKKGWTIERSRAPDDYDRWLRCLLDRKT